MSQLLARLEADARAVIARCVAPEGFRASALPGGYDQVWARDSMIVAVTVCSLGLTDFIPAVVASLRTLTDGQSTLGYVPLNVHAGGRRDQGDPGGVDSNLWFVIGHHALERTGLAADFVAGQREAVERSMLWARYQDSDDDDLIESQEAADWADLLANRGKVLYPNVLFVIALRAYADLAAGLGWEGGPAHRALADRVVARLLRLHWVESGLGLDAGPLPGEHAETQRIRSLLAATLWERPYFLPWVGFRDFGDWCDVLGNCLAILCGVADDRRRRRILTYLEQVGAGTPVPARALHPPVHPGDKDWREYQRNGNLNQPYQYHNGGAFPMVGGFFIASYVADGRYELAATLLERLALVLEREDDGHGPFSEWYHGQTGRAMGKPLQAWSAAMFLYAKRAVEDGRVPWPFVERPEGPQGEQPASSPAAASAPADEDDTSG